MTLAEAERLAEQSLTNYRPFLYAPPAVCEWCAADIINWINDNGYAVCPECLVIS